MGLRGAGIMGDVPGDLHVHRSLVIPDHELSWRFSRSSGPGGQGVNTTDSRVELSYDVQGSPALTDVHRSRALERLGSRLTDGVLTVTGSEHRSQLRNREAAEARLAALLRDAIAPPPKTRRPTKPSRGAQQRRIDAKKQRGQIKANRQRPDY
ncbi:alternative ribosome rescue aminoacyl-tRNA hydrolase ArfB [Acidothermaceae bacterium B102]|nr:alternative ribosome rescue aminoacyl-tRNA hydrolase ArfB [Acidothermaceae bacterium B102]